MAKPTPIIPQNPIKNTDSARNGSYLQIGILVQRLYNLGESSQSLRDAFNQALTLAKSDGIGQE